MVIDTAKLKVSTKSLVAAFTTFGVVMQVPAVKDLVLGITSAHPRIASLLTTAAGIYVVLHEPAVQEALGIKQTVTVATEKVTIAPPDAQ